MVMTIDDEIQLAPATTGEGSIVPEGRYTLHLIRLEKAPPSTFKPEDGPRVKWVFNLYAELVEGMERGTLFHFDGKPYEFWRQTSTKNSPRAYARKYAEALRGEKMAEGEVPKLGSLIGLKMSAAISYDDDPDDATNKILMMNGLRNVPVEIAKPAPKPAAPAFQVSADASDDDIDRALLVSKITSSLKALKALDETSWKVARAAWVESDPDEALLDDLRVLSDEISRAVRVARGQEE